jgi:hypothetical protein
MVNNFNDISLSIPQQKNNLANVINNYGSVQNAKC